MEKKERTKKIEHVVGGLLRKIEQSGVKKAGAVNEAWLLSVGEKTSEHTSPVSFKKGILMVITENSTWLYKMTLEKRNIIKKFNENYTGRQKVKEIRFRVGRTEL